MVVLNKKVKLVLILFLVAVIFACLFTSVCAGYGIYESFGSCGSKHHLEEYFGSCGTRAPPLEENFSDCMCLDEEGKHKH